ncbi:methionine aminopeptidase [Peribacillus sp. JNUCC 23]
MIWILKQNKEKSEVSKMGLFQTISAWNTARQEKHIALMQDKGLCPDCRGRGFSSYAPYDYSYTNVYDCLGCNGSGSYVDWVETTNQTEG